jgi:hypothetical protein
MVYVLGRYWLLHVLKLEISWHIWTSEESAMLKLHLKWRWIERISKTMARVPTKNSFQFHDGSRTHADCWTKCIRKQGNCLEKHMESVPTVWLLYQIYSKITFNFFVALIFYVSNLITQHEIPNSWAIKPLLLPQFRLTHSLSLTLLEREGSNTWKNWIWGSHSSDYDE